MAYKIGHMVQKLDANGNTYSESFGECKTGCFKPATCHQFSNFKACAYPTWEMTDAQS